MNDRKYYQNREFRKLQKEWYDKASDSGFEDIEGGVDGHLMRGQADSVSLKSLANKYGLKKDRAVREFDEVAGALDELIDYPDGGKARYFHHAALLACQAFREGMEDSLCFAWLLHAQGIGERTISDYVETPRSKIRKHIAQLRDNLQTRIDNDHR